MSDQPVAGIDIHKDFLVVTVLGKDTKKTKEYQTHETDLNHLKRWLARMKVDKVAMEATGIYMIPCCDKLKDRFELYLVNAADVRMLPGKKTDILDSEWLAVLLQKDLLKKSYIPPKEWRDIRELFRQRKGFVHTKSRVKNKVTKILTQEGFNLSRAFSDVFGKTSRMIIDQLVSQKSLKQILRDHAENRYVKPNIEVLSCLPRSKSLSDAICFVLTLLLDELDQSQQRIDLLDQQLAYMTQEVFQKQSDLEILKSMPGISDKIAIGIITELNSVDRFPSAKHLVSYAGLSPAVYESGGKRRNKGLNKRGNKYLRTLFIEAAWGASRTKTSRLRQYYHTKRSQKGKKKAIVALAAKMMRIAYHLLKYQEMYVEDHFRKNLRNVLLPNNQTSISLGELDRILRSRGLRIATSR